MKMPSLLIPILALSSTPTLAATGMRGDWKNQIKNNR